MIARHRHPEHPGHGRDRDAGPGRAPTPPKTRTAACRPPARDPSRRCREDVAFPPELAHLGGPSRAGSSASALAGPFSSRPPVLPTELATQLRIDCAVGSNSRAIPLRLRPDRTRSIICRTALRRVGSTCPGQGSHLLGKRGGVHETGSTPIPTPAGRPRRPLRTASPSISGSNRMSNDPRRFPAAL